MTKSLHEIIPLSVFCTNANTLHNIMQGLRIRIADSSLNVLALTETWGKQGIKDAELAIMEDRLSRKDHGDNRKGGWVVILVKDAMPVVPHHLPNTPHKDVLAYDIGPPNSCHTSICIYCPSRVKLQDVCSSRLTSTAPIVSS